MSLTVVCVEDERSIRRVYARILKKLGVKVILFEDADKAIAELANIKFDILVTDLNTETDYNGYSVIAYVRSLNPSIPCILISADPDEYEELAKPDCVIIKPAELSELRRIFGNYIKQLS